MLAFAVLVAAGFFGGSIAAVAQQDPTTTTVLPSPTTTVAPTTTTTAPVTPPTSAPQQPGPSPATPAQKTGPTTTTTLPSAPHVVPPEFVPMINSVRRGPPNNTGALLDALAPLRDFGVPEEQAAIIGFGRFPVAGLANYSDDWWTPRYTPVFHLHQGNDIFAALDTPVRAPADGVLRQSNEAVGGLSVYVTQADGTFFYGAHLDTFVKGQASGQHVKTGDVIGFVGNTGDAVGGPTHLHFEIHPKGGAAVDPNQYLNQWIKDAIANVPALVASFQSSRPEAVVATVLTRQLTEGGSGLFAAPASPPQSQLLWATAASPSAGAVRYAQAQATAAVRDMGWSTLTRDEAERVQAWQAADTAAKAVLAQFTPRRLWTILGVNQSS